MGAQYPELEVIAAKLDSIGDKEGASVVRKALAKLDACGHEIERLLVDIESLNLSLDSERARR